MERGLRLARTTVLALVRKDLRILLNETPAFHYALMGMHSKGKMYLQ